MSIEIIDILKPKNGLSFKLIEDIDIAVSGYESLADAVAHFATKEAMIAAINLALSGKQDTLTTPQLAAVNSGITSALVTQIGTNTTAIAGKASQADLDTTNATLAGKASTSDLTTATASLQAQIDNIVSGSTADSEVINARVDVGGKTYNTLKARLDADVAKISGSLAEFENYIYDNNIVNKRFTAVSYGQYTITAQGEISYNTNYDSYIFAVDAASVNKIQITGTVAVCGWFAGLPLTVTTTIDETRHTDYSDSEVSVVTGTAYFFANVLTGGSAPIITAVGESIIDELTEDVASLSDNYHQLVGSTAPLPTDEWEIGTFTLSNGTIEYKARSYDIRTKQNTTKHLEKGMEINIINDTNDRFTLLIGIKKGTTYTVKAIGVKSYIIDETGDYVITVEDSTLETLSNVSTILDHVQLFYSGIFENEAVGSENLFNYDTTVYDSFVSDNTETENARWYHSDYIDVESGHIYAINCTASSLGEYYNGTTYVDTIRRNSYTQPSANYSIFIVPAGVTKVRVNGYLEEGNGSPSLTVRPESYMMVEGRIMPDKYIPYGTQTPELQIKDTLLPDFVYNGNILYNKKLLTFGDSITDGRNHQYVNNSDKGYILNYAGYVAERNGMTYYNKGWSGGTISYGQKSLVPSSGDTFNILLTDIGTPDIITFMYGFNDCNNSENHELGDIDSTDRTTFCGAWNFTIPQIRTLYPNARLGIIIPYGMEATWNAMLIKIANKYGIPYWDMNDGQTYCIRGNGTSDLDPDVAAELTAKYTYDGTHPNDAGYNLISNQYEAFLRRI